MGKALDEPKQSAGESKKSERQAIQLLPLSDYDHILAMVSGGKDSIGSLVHLEESGADMTRVELWHQCVDGGQDDPEYFDWPVTEGYCAALGQALGIPVSYQWRAGGIHGEMMRENAPTGDVFWRGPDGVTHRLPTLRNSPGTRLRFPQMSADLSVRWCSAYAKVDVAARVLANHPKYQGTPMAPKRILVITGERREESANRAKYLSAEVHRCDVSGRVVHQWRPVLDWSEAMVWDALRRRGIRPHPAYEIGFSRVSCMGCVFCTADLWAMIRHIAPDRFAKLVAKEAELKVTIDRKLTLTEKADLGTLWRFPDDPRLPVWVDQALSPEYSVEHILVPPAKWELPRGAFLGHAGGPS